MRPSFFDIFFDARNSLFGYVTNTNIPDYASMQYSNIYKNCKYIIAFKIRQLCQHSSSNIYGEYRIEVPSSVPLVLS